MDHHQSEPNSMNNHRISNNNNNNNSNVPGEGENDDDGVSHIFAPQEKNSSKGSTTNKADADDYQNNSNSNDDDDDDDDDDGDEVTLLLTKKNALPSSESKRSENDNDEAEKTPQHVLSLPFQNDETNQKQQQQQQQDGKGNSSQNEIPNRPLLVSSSSSSNDWKTSSKRITAVGEVLTTTTSTDTDTDTAEEETKDKRPPIGDAEDKPISRVTRPTTTTTMGAASPTSNNKNDNEETTKKAAPSTSPPDDDTKGAETDTSPNNAPSAVVVVAASLKESSSSSVAPTVSTSTADASIPLHHNTTSIRRRQRASRASSLSPHRSSRHQQRQSAISPRGGGGGGPQVQSFVSPRRSQFHHHRPSHQQRGAEKLRELLPSMNMNMNMNMNIMTTETIKTTTPPSAEPKDETKESNNNKDNNKAPPPPASLEEEDGTTLTTMSTLTPRSSNIAGSDINDINNNNNNNLNEVIDPHHRASEADEFAVQQILRNLSSCYNDDDDNDDDDNDEDDNRHNNNDNNNNNHNDDDNGNPKPHANNDHGSHNGNNNSQSRRNEHGGDNSIHKPKFHIDVFIQDDKDEFCDSTTPPNARKQQQQCANIRIFQGGPTTTFTTTTQSMNNNGLLTIVLMALNVEKWNILQVHMTKPLPPSVATAASSQEEEEEQQQSPQNNNDNDDGRIVVQIPDGLDGTQKTALLDELRVLLLSACEDFASPRRSLKPLIHAFETTIEPRRISRIAAARQSTVAQRERKLLTSSASVAPSSSLAVASASTTTTARPTRPPSRMSTATAATTTTTTCADADTDTPELTTNIRSSSTGLPALRLSERQHHSSIYETPRSVPPPFMASLQSSDGDTMPCLIAGGSGDDDGNADDDGQYQEERQQQERGGVVGLSDEFEESLRSGPRRRSRQDNFSNQSVSTTHSRFGMDIDDVHSGDEDSIRPGAYPAMGRAYGAPYRQSRRNLLARLHSSTRQWISNRLLGQHGGPDHEDSHPDASSAYRANTTLPSNADNTIEDRSLAFVPLAVEVVENMDDMEANIRERVLRDAATASVVSVGDPTVILEKAKRRKTQRNLLVVLAILLFGTVIGMAAGFAKKEAVDDDDDDDDEEILNITPTAMVSIAPTGNPTSSPTMTAGSTLEAIQERGTVRCCVATGHLLAEFEASLCRGLAAAVLGDPDKVEFTPEGCPWPDIFDELRERTTDVGIYSVTHTTSRSINEIISERPLAFSSPYFYDGFAFGGLNEELVDCANRLDSYFGICRRLMVCVLAGTSHVGFVKNRLPSQHIRVHDNRTNSLIEGPCNVIGTDASFLETALKTAVGGADEVFHIGSNLFTREPLAMITKPDDREWSLFVETFLQGLLEAEARNVTKANSSMFPSVPYFDPAYQNMISQAVASIGNFGELYEQAIGSHIPRVGLNRLRTDNNCEDEGGLIYGFPFGRTLDGDPIEHARGKLREVVQRGELWCGVPDSMGDAYKFHREICRAVSAAMFGGSTNRIKEVPFPVGSKAAFDLLSNGAADILFGVGTHSLPVLKTNLSNFTLSKPYMFHPTTDGGDMEPNLLVTANDHQWFAFAQWVIMILINAEEMLISKEQNDFSAALSLGPNYNNIFHEVIAAVGNYGEIYERINVTRSGCNRLNTAPNGPQHFPFLFDGV